MKWSKSMILVGLGLVTLALVGVVAAQSGDGFEISTSTMDNGGRYSAGGSYWVGGTIGQSDSGVHIGGDFELTTIPGFIPITNDPTLTALVHQVGADLLGEENVEVSPLEMGAEDFSYFARMAPGCFFELGGAIAEGPTRRHHHPYFNVDEGCLPLGAALLAETAIRYLTQAIRP